jgi:DNA-binding NarL/FixJ family response regulator
MPMKILIADDHELYRDALSILVQRLDKAAEIHLSSSYDELLAFASSERDWDLMLVDLNMPGLSYYDGIAQLTDAHPNTPVIVVTSSEDPKDTQLALKAGALGYMSKAMKSSDMLNAIQLMLNSGISIHPTHQLASDSLSTSASSEPASLDKLTPRQQEVLKRLCEGESNKRIALNLDLSEHTVKLHVRAILHALNAENRTQAVIVAKRLLF